MGLWFERGSCFGLRVTSDGQDSNWVLKAPRVVLLLTQQFSQLYNR